MVLLNVPLFNEILLDSCSVKISQNPLHFDCTFETAIKMQSMKDPTKTIALGLHFQKCNESAMKMKQMLNQYEGNFSKTSSKLRSNLDESALKMKILHCNHGIFLKKSSKSSKKHDALLMHNDALLMHNDALLMHFHRVLMHF